METFNLKVNEALTLSLTSKGSMGFQLLVRQTCNNVAEIEISSRIPENFKPNMAGDPMQKNIIIRAIGIGSCFATFYHKQPWLENGPEFIEKEIVVNVTKE